MSAPAGAGSRPAGLSIAAALLAVQAAAAFALAVYLIYADLTADKASGVIAWGVTAFTLAGAAALAAVSWALFRGRGAARGPAIALELMLIAPAYFMIGSWLTWLGLLIAAMVAAIIVLLLRPSTSGALGLADRRGQS